MVCCLAVHFRNRLSRILKPFGTNVFQGDVIKLKEIARSCSLVYRTVLLLKLSFKKAYSFLAFLCTNLELIPLIFTSFCEQILFDFSLQCSFSNGGHLFAAVHGNVIQLYSSTTFENVGNLKGHNGKVFNHIFKHEEINACFPCLTEVRYSTRQIPV